MILLSTMMMITSSGSWDNNNTDHFKKLSYMKIFLKSHTFSGPQGSGEYSGPHFNLIFIIKL